MLLNQTSAEFIGSVLRIIVVTEFKCYDSSAPFDSLYQGEDDATKNYYLGKTTICCVGVCTTFRFRLIYIFIYGVSLLLCILNWFWFCGAFIHVVHLALVNASPLILSVISSTYPTCFLLHI